MSKDLLIFKDNHIEVYGEGIDKLKKFKNPFAEALDGPGSRFLMRNVINPYLSPLIPDPIKVETHEAMDAHINAMEDGVYTEEEKERIAKEFSDIPEKIILRADLSESNKKIIKGVFGLIDGVMEEVIK